MMQDMTVKGGGASPVIFHCQEIHLLIHYCPDNDKNLWATGDHMCPVNSFNINPLQSD